ncbi:hypothetical protein [Streptomyces omiyaensis]|uniref:hypothetical protein n=1 Tax=Streptomyces omiyaensis TaxID=68247 RepID=UPI0036FD4DD8
MTRTLARVGALVAALLIMLTSGTSIAFAGAKPPDPYPESLSHGERVGINKQTGEYCDLDDADQKKRLNCRAPEDCQDFPAGQTVCIGEGSSDPEDARTFELNELKRWEKKADKNAPNYEKYHSYLVKCVKTDKKSFQQCNAEAAGKYPPPAKTPLDWVAGKISDMAANALEEAASMLGHSVVWLLKQFADAFNSISTIDLSKTGIGPVLGITTGLSVIIAAFLMLVQFSKVAVSQQGGPAATAIVGLAKWGVILGVYLFGTQVALNWSDTLSTALINYTFDSGGSTNGDAADAMEKQLGMLFSGLVGGGGATAAGSALITGSGIAPTAVGFVIVISILCILAIGALWVEMLVRQAGIMILVTMIPVALAGSMSDATKDWWPKTRNALVALILMKPTIVIIFSIGFSAMSGAEGVRNVIVGLIIFVVAATSWPVLAKFIVLSSNGEGNSAASGMISSVGSSVSSMFGGNQAAPSGAGTVGGGGGYTKALEGENSSAASESNGGGGGGGGGFWSKAMLGSKGGSFMGKAGGVVGVGLQVAAVGKDMAESSLQNAAAHAGLGHGAQGGRHVVVPPRSSGQDQPAAVPAQPATQESEPPTPTPSPAPPPPNPTQTDGS